MGRSGQPKKAIASTLLEAFNRLRGHKAATFCREFCVPKGLQAPKWKVRQNSNTHSKSPFMPRTFAGAGVKAVNLRLPAGEGQSPTSEAFLAWY